MAKPNRYTNKIQPVFNYLKSIFSHQKIEEESVIESADEDIYHVDSQYLHRFEQHSLQNKDQLKGREESFKLLSKAYESWQDTKNPLLVVSESGMGTSSLLFSSTNIYPEAIVLEDNINFFSSNQLLHTLQNKLEITGDYQSFEQLAKHAKKKQVVIFENIERLFLRTINGFSALDDFILFVHQTKSTIYWLLTINRYSYYYLSRVRDFSSNFGSIIFLKPVGDEIIKDIINERNQGYNVVYLPQKKEVLPNEYKKLNPNEKQEFLKGKFFKQLLSFSEGNISRALEFWRKSVVRSNEKTIYMRAFEPKMLSDLNLEEILILEAILQHSSLSVEELQTVSRSSSKGSKLAIEKLLEKDAIIEKQYNNIDSVEYQINPLYMNSVKQLFRNRLNRNFV